MFHREPSLTWVPATREQVVAIIESINQPQVSIPGMPPQTVTGHLCALRNANGTFSIYVGLFVPRTGDNFVYVNEKRQVTLEEYRDIEIEGLQFLESMGFMLDNLNYRNLSAEMQERTVRRIPLFGGRPEQNVPPAAVPTRGPGAPQAGQAATLGPSSAGPPGAGLAAAAAPYAPLGPGSPLGQAPAPAPVPAPAPAPFGPRESAALARLLASF